MSTDRNNLFGKLAFREGLVTDIELEDSLKAQAKDAANRPLGEIMVELGFLSKKQVAQILRKQNKAIMACDACSISFNVLLPPPGQPAEPACPKCRNPLTEHRPPRVLSVDSELNAVAPGEEKGDMNLTRAVFSIDPEDAAASLEEPRSESEKPAGAPKRHIGKRDSRIEPGKKKFSDTMKGLPPTRPFTSVIRRPKGQGEGERPKAAGPTMKAALCPICKTTFEGTVDKSGHMRCSSCHTRFKAR